MGTDIFMRILHLTSWPGPPFNGGNINRYHILKRLSRRHDFRLIVICPPEENSELNAIQLSDLGIQNSGTYVCKAPKAKLATRIQFLLISDYPPGVASWIAKLGPYLQSKIDSISKTWAPDLIMAWSPNHAGLVSKIAADQPCVLFACDSLNHLHESIARQSKNCFRKLYHKMIARRYFGYQCREYRNFKRVIFVSDRDRQACNLDLSINTAVIPNGVDTNELRPNSRPTTSVIPRVLFHGDYRYSANTEAALRLINVIGPELVQNLGPNGFELRIIGGHANDKLISSVANKPWAKIVGYVENLQSELAVGTVYAAPITIGSGIKNKVLEAMACGLPVVGTPEAFNSIAIETHQEAIQSAIEDFPTQIASLLIDEKTRHAISVAARKHVVSYCDYDAVARKFEQVFRHSASTLQAKTIRHTPAA